MTLDRSDRDKLHEAQRTVRRLRSRERKEAKANRSASPKASRGRVLDPGYLAWLRTLACAVGPDGCDGGLEAAHIRYAKPGEQMTGMQRKSDDCRAVPLCRAHHREGPDAQHRTNERAWWKARGIDPHELAAALYAEFCGRNP